MTLDSIITMAIVLGGLWGAFIFLLVKALRPEEKNPFEGQL